MRLSTRFSALMSGFITLLVVQNAQAMPAPAGTSDVTPTLTGRDNGVETPIPYQPGMVDNCDKFYLVSAGQTCSQIAGANGIAPSRLLEWNGVAGNCYGLWANYYVCVHTIGYAPTTSLTCSTNGWAWGDNKSAVDDAIVKWCSANGSSNYTGDQTKNGCFNTPIGKHTIKFSIRNYNGAPSTLAPATCKRMLSDLVNGCSRGGSGLHEYWLLEASVPQGQC